MRQPPGFPTPAFLKQKLINNHCGVVMPKTESPEKSPCGLPHPSPSQGMFKWGVYPGPQSKAYIPDAGATLHKALSDCSGNWGAVGGFASCRDNRVVGGALPLMGWGLFSLEVYFWLVAGIW